VSLTILNVAYPLAPVGPDAVGGAEQILTQIDHGLVACGHHSIVIAQAGSQTAGTFVPVPVEKGFSMSWPGDGPNAAIVTRSSPPCSAGRCTSSICME
jgi:hypothetical protein